MNVSASPIAFMVPIGVPTPLHWARLAVRRIISADPLTPPHRRAHIERFCEHVSETIEPFFRNPAKSQAKLAAKAILECFQASEWRALAVDAGRQLEVRFILDAVFTEAQEAFFRLPHTNIG